MSMVLVGAGEIYYFSGEKYSFARFEKPDGSIFDLPVSEEQLELLMSDVLEYGGEEMSSPPEPAPTELPAPGPREATSGSMVFDLNKQQGFSFRDALDDDELAELAEAGSIRLGTFASEDGL